MPFPWIPALIIAGAAAIVGVNKASKTNNKSQKSESVITDEWKYDTKIANMLQEKLPPNIVQLENDDLLPGELSAFTFTIGCYTIRSAERIYQVSDDSGTYANNYTIPADKEYIDSLGNAQLGVAHLMGKEWSIGRKHRLVQEITARHNIDPKGAFVGGFKHVCWITKYASHTQWENLISISTVKEAIPIPDEHASLIVCRMRQTDCSYGGSTTYYWHELNPKGIVKELGKKVLAD